MTQREKQTCNLLIWGSSCNYKAWRSTEFVKLLSDLLAAACLGHFRSIKRHFLYLLLIHALTAESMTCLLLLFSVRLCDKWTKAGSGQGNSSICLRPLQCLRCVSDSSNDLRWLHGRRSGLLPGIHLDIKSADKPTWYWMFLTIVNPDQMCIVQNMVQNVNANWFGPVSRETVVDPWCVRQPVGTGGWQGWWAGERVVDGAISQASTAE